MRRVVGIVLAMVCCAAAPAAASASVTVGPDLTPNSSERDSCNCTIAGGPADTSYQSPISGVIVHWSVKNTSGPVALRVISGETAKASSNQEEASAFLSTIQTFDSRLPITQGERIGIDVVLGVSEVGSFPGGSIETWNPVLANGETRTGVVTSGRELAINATVEPDVDHDGYGDETQDQCPTDATTQGACPAAASPQTSRAEDRKCRHLRRKRKRQRGNLGNALTTSKRSTIEANIKDTRKRLARLGCR
jgi:hypothetical protein